MAVELNSAHCRGMQFFLTHCRNQSLDIFVLPKRLAAVLIGGASPGKLPLSQTHGPTLCKVTYDSYRQGKNLFLKSLGKLCTNHTHHRKSKVYPKSQSNLSIPNPSYTSGGSHRKHLVPKFVDLQHKETEENKT